ncbi:PLAC8 family-domain-containing protein [Astrocystis sublimbata]|nr:PLAC8 family-domain-containing protein [Astrocystis sublimbata]
MATQEKYGQEQGVYGQAPMSHQQPYQPQHQQQHQHQQPYTQPPPMAANHQSHRQLEKEAGEWQTGICSCGPCSSCLLAWCLPCLLLGQTSERMRDPSMQSADNCNSDCLIYTAISCFTGCGWIYAMLKRGEIRERYGIQGSGCNDCCVSYWCPCCALIQQDNEVKIRHEAQPLVQGYQAQPGMHMPQPAPAYQPHQ